MDDQNFRHSCTNSEQVAMPRESSPITANSGHTIAWSKAGRLSGAIVIALSRFSGAACNSLAAAAKPPIFDPEDQDC